MDRKAKAARAGWMVVALLPLFSGVAGADNPVRPGTSQRDQQIAIETVRGTVKSVGTFRLEGTSLRGVRLRLQMGGGKVVTVRTGPRSYLEREGVHFQRGEQVTVTGSRVAGRQNVLVASQLKIGDKTVALRSTEGEPLWNLKELKSSARLGSPRNPEHSDDLRRAYEW